LKIRYFYQVDEEFRLFTKKVPDPHRFGVPVYLNDKVIDIVEKPKTPSTNKAVVGLYCYSSNVFEVIEGLQPSARGEYEISEVNSYLVKNKKGSFFDVECGWVDAGTHESYKKANEMIWERVK
jgi:glucose-1-phosphate thymidylyltransferase